MSIRTLVSGALLLLLALQESAFAVLIPDGSDISLYNAYGATSQFNSVVGLGGYDGTKWVNDGRGVVISDHCVLTAAHCALGNNGSLFTNYVAVPGTNLTKDYWGYYMTSNVTVSPLYTGITSTDLAILTFPDVITSSKVVPAKLFTGDDSTLVGTLGDYGGFGYWKYKSADGSAAIFDGERRACQQMISQLGYPEFGAGTDQFVMNWAVSSQYLSGIAYAYDSGGGWFIDGASQPTLYAINDWTTPTYPFNGATSVSQHIQWIDSVIGVPEPSSIVMFAIGGVCFFGYWLRRRRV